MRIVWIIFNGIVGWLLFVIITAAVGSWSNMAVHSIVSGFDVIALVSVESLSHMLHPSSISS